MKLDSFKSIIIRCPAFHLPFNAAHVLDASRNLSVKGKLVLSALIFCNTMLFSCSFVMFRSNIYIITFFLSISISDLPVLYCLQRFIVIHTHVFIISLPLVQSPSAVYLVSCQCKLIYYHVDHITSGQSSEQLTNQFLHRFTTHI